MRQTDMELVERALSGDRRSQARLITQIEAGQPEARAALQELYPHTGRAQVIGITGSPGVGKSTLTDRLIQSFRDCDRTVGVVAVDPSSPFTGGAILGDRVRMNDRTLDPGVFIRSLATRGSLGGLSRATGDVIKVFDACGYDVIIVETVGTGQAEVDIIQLAHTTVVVVVPGLGDDIQAIKAGILEIADVFAVNKSDLPGHERTFAEIQNMLDLGGERDWRPPLIATIARDNTGVAELRQSIDDHFAHLTTTGQLGQRQRALVEREISGLVTDRLAGSALAGARASGRLNELVAAAARRELTPDDAAGEIARTWLDSRTGRND
jgi:LAO/AO transport system kinase